MARKRDRSIVLHVATHGKDAWSGRLAQPNARKTDGPLATPAGARDALRRLRRRGAIEGPVRVVIHGGTHFLKAPLELTPEDSGSPDAPVTFVAADGEAPILSGGRRIRGFRPVTVGGRKLWAAPVPAAKSGRWDFRELFVNGRTSARPRLPRKGFYTIAKDVCPPTGAQYHTPQNRFGYAAGDLQKWKNLTDVDVVVLHYWAESRLRVKSLDVRKRVVTFSNTTRRRLVTRKDRPSKYYVENVFEGIAPGEWYLDKPKGRLYYMPLPGETIDDLVVIAPRLDAVVRVCGEPSEGRLVEHVHFEALSFRHAAVAFETIAASVQAAAEVPGAVVFTGARNCSVTRCEVTQAGTYGLELRDGCRAVSFVGNHLHDLGAGGVTMTGAPTASRPKELTCNHVVTDNHIHHGGRICHSAVGILCRHSGGNTLSHNHIHHLYYTGISIGWIWGYKESVAQNNLVENNHIHDLGHGWLSDMGGIYTLGNLAGGVLRRNLIHDVTADVYGGWGLYTDEGSTHLVLEENVTYNTNTGGFHQHYGRENVVRNNVFGPSAISHMQRTRQEDHLSFTLIGNIFYIHGGEFISGRWDRAGYITDRNVFFRADGKALRFGAETFRQWQARGNDVSSVVADPRFVDADNHDYRLLPDSPALAMGFRPIDLSAVGPRPGLCRDDEVSENRPDPPTPV